MINKKELSTKKKKQLTELRAQFFDYLSTNLKGQVPLALLHAPKLNNLSECTCRKHKDCNALAKHPNGLFVSKIKTGEAFDYSRKDFKEDRVNRYNMGAICGYSLDKTHGADTVLIIVDIDSKDPWNTPFVKNVLDKDGKEALETFGYLTGSGGMHLWYAVDKSYGIHNNSVSKVETGIDIRGVNGYGVVPGSLHKSGNLYDFDKEHNQGFHLPIRKLPQSALEAIVASNGARIPKIKKSDKNKLQGVKNKRSLGSMLLPPLANGIKDLKKILRSNPSYMIPEGARNQTIYRLLAHDRSMGANRKMLVEKGKYYRTRCQDHKSIKMQEIHTIVSSAHKNKPKVLKVTSHKDLARNYFIWKENLHNVKFTKKEKSDILKCDEDFFGRLTTCNENGQDVFLPISKIHEMRDAYIKEYHGLHGFFRYPQKFLAERLKELGFQRKRTAKGNLWNVHVPAWEKIIDIPKKKNMDVYSNSLMVYSNRRNNVSTSITTRQDLSMTTTITIGTTPAGIPGAMANIASQIAGTIAGTAAPAPSTTDETTTENTRPTWASTTEKPHVIYGENVDQADAFVPPGYQDEVVIKYGDFIRHPDETKYFRFGMPVNGHFDLEKLFQNFIDTVTPEEGEAFGNLAFIRDVDATAAAFDSIQEGDVIGTLTLDEPTNTYALEVLKRLTDRDTLVCRPWNGEIKDRKWRPFNQIITEDPEVDVNLQYITFEDISYALAMNHFNIIYRRNAEYDPESEERDDFGRLKTQIVFKPFGFEDQKKEYKMRFRYRVAEGYPGHVSDDKLDEEYKTAWAAYVKECQDKAEAEAQAAQAAGTNTTNGTTTATNGI